MPKTVLVVDDDPLVLEVTAEMLADLGCAVITASDGSEAMQKIRDDERIELLMADINMPGLSGYELAEVARRHRPGLHVVLISGRESDGRGFPFIRKPFLENDLKRVMGETTGPC